MAFKEVGRFNADENHDVVSLRGDSDGSYCKKPCEECPWRLDSPVGAFPADAYRHSARCAQNMSGHTFACHMAGTGNPKTCAGFLLKGSRHNMAVRLALSAEKIKLEEVSSEVDLYDNYVDMAVANGVPLRDPALRNCRVDTAWDDDEWP